MILLDGSYGWQGLLFFLALGAFITIGLVLSRDKNRNGMLRRVAGRVGGTMTEGGWLGESRVDFRIAGRDAQLVFFSGSKYNPPYSRVSVSLGGLFPGTLHILEDGFGQSFLKFFGAQDLTIGDALFDRDYVVKATPESLAARVFSPERRTDVIRTVRTLTGLVDPTIDVTPQQLTVQVRQYLRDEAMIMALAVIAKDFLAHALAEPASAGIKLGEVTAAAGGHCPVCGTELGGRTVRCAQCGTAHHGECWAYMGRCSTYACPGRSAR